MWSQNGSPGSDYGSYSVHGLFTNNSLIYFLTERPLYVTTTDTGVVRTRESQRFRKREKSTLNVIGQEVKRFYPTTETEETFGGHWNFVDGPPSLHTKRVEPWEGAIPKSKVSPDSVEKGPKYSTILSRQFTKNTLFFVLLPNKTSVVQ